MVQSHLLPFRNLGNFVHSTFAWVFQKTQKADSPFYLVSTPGEVKDPTQGVNVQRILDSLILKKDNFCISPSLCCLEETT